MTDINIKFNKTAQQFFFISNLAEWHFSCNPIYNKLWIKDVGPLSQKEEIALKRAAPVFKKYDFDDENTNHYLGKPFIDYPEDEIWDNVSKMVNERELEILKSVFEVLEEKFNLLWKKDKKRLEILSEELKRETGKQEIKNVLKILENLFEKAEEFTIHIFAIPAKSPTSAGGANTKRGVVTLELRELRDVKEGMLIALHEITHQLFRLAKINISELTKAITPQEKTQLNKIPLFREQGLESAIEEITLIPLLPDGVLKQYITHEQQKVKIKKYLDLNKRADLENFLICHMREKSLEYINNNRKIDQDYIRFVVKKAVEFTKTKGLSKN